MYKIGLIGKMGAGKTFISDALVNQCGGQRMAFADGLKKDVMDLNLTEDGKIVKQRDRRILQDYGQLRRGEIFFMETPTARVRNMAGSCYVESIATLNSEIIRNYQLVGPCEKDHWVNQLIYNAQQKSDESIIVDDIRRINEATALASIGFVILKVDCPDEVRLERLRTRDGSFDPATFNNISETEVDSIPYDFKITNDGSLNPVNEIVNLTSIIK